jgi:hypothetical protein
MMQSVMLIVSSRTGVHQFENENEIISSEIRPKKEISDSRWLNENGFLHNENEFLHGVLAELERVNATFSPRR